jgi:hypothetical protein
MDYLASLNPKQRLALDIAKRNLGSSFHLEKSNGYLKFKEKEKKEKEKEKDITPTPMK